MSEADLEIYLKEIIEKPEPNVDEYGQEIPVYRKVFSFILEQRQEVKAQNCAVIWGAIEQFFLTSKVNIKHYQRLTLNIKG